MTEFDESEDLSECLPFPVSFTMEADDLRRANLFANFLYSAGLETEVLINPETCTYFVWITGEAK